MTDDLTRRRRRAFRLRFDGDLVEPEKDQVHLAVHFIAVAAVVITSLTGITDVKRHVRRGAKLLQHGIESLGWPVEQAAEAVNRDPVLPASEAAASVVEALLEPVWIGHAHLLFLRFKPLDQGLAHGMIA